MVSWFQPRASIACLIHSLTGRTWLSLCEGAFNETILPILLATGPLIDEDISHFTQVGGWVGGHMLRMCGVACSDAG